MINKMPFEKAIKMHQMPIYEEHAWKNHSLYKKKMKKLKRLYKKIAKTYIIKVLMEEWKL